MPAFIRHCSELPLTRLPSFQIDGMLGSFGQQRPALHAAKRPKVYWGDRLCRPAVVPEISANGTFARLIRRAALQDVSLGYASAARQPSKHSAPLEPTELLLLNPERLSVAGGRLATDA